MCKSSTLFLAGLLLLVAACNKPLFDTMSHSGRVPPSRGSGGQPSAAGDSTDTAGPRAPDIFVTALGFPEDSLWREGDYRGGEVLLFKNGKLLLSVPSGNGAPAERHRYRDGHLWVDSSDGFETVLYRDGEEVFRFHGEELFRGFVVQDEQVYTLGQRQGNEGFSYRVNGQERFSSPTGTLLGGPMDREWPGGAFSENLHYAYGLPMEMEGRLQWEYRIMQGENTVKVIPAGQAETIYDIRYWQDVLYRSERSTGGTLCMVQGDSYKAMHLEEDAPFHICKLAPYDGVMFMKGYSEREASPRYSFWYRTSETVRHAGSSDDWIPDLLVYEKRTAYVTIASDGLVSAVRRNESVLKQVPPATYKLTSPLCCDWQKGIFAVALSSARGSDHLLLVDNEATTLTFNGFFTSIQIIP